MLFQRPRHNGQADKVSIRCRDVLVADILLFSAPKFNARQCALCWVFCLSGTGTRFLGQVAANNPTCLDAIRLGPSGTNDGAIASVDSNTQITLATARTGSNQTNVALTTNVGGLCGFNDWLSDYVNSDNLL